MLPVPTLLLDLAAATLCVVVLLVLLLLLQVSRVEPYGVFVQLHRSQVRGLVHMSQVDKEYSKELNKHYTPGQIVSVR